MSADFDVIIVGAGLAGGSLALALAKLSLKVALVEAVPESVRLASSAGERALAMAYGSAQILQQIGVWEEAQAQVAPILQIHVSDQGHFGKLRMNAKQEQVPALGYVVTARVLETAVAAGLAASSIQTYCPAQVVALESRSEAVQLGLQSQGETLQLTARLVVAADGGHSMVRKLLGIGQIERDYAQTAVVTEILTSKVGDFTAFERFTANGPLAMLPMGKKRYSLVWTKQADEADGFIQSPEAEFLAKLQQEFGWRLGQLSLGAQRQGFPLKLIRAERMTGDRVVLVGNAAHQLHPVAGQGLNLGLRDVALLAEMLEARLAFGEEIGERAFLERYAAARIADHDKVIGFTDTTVRIFSNQFAPLALARNLGLLTLDRFSKGKGVLARYAMGLGSRIPRFG